MTGVKKRCYSEKIENKRYTNSLIVKEVAGSLQPAGPSVRPSLFLSFCIVIKMYVDIFPL